jgi:hypothetical protein
MSSPLSKANAIARSAVRSNSARHHAVEVAYAALPIEMLASAAFRELSLGARKILDRLEIELASEGDMNANGQLVVTFANLCFHGLDRHSIGPAMRELEALGFIRIKQGRAGNPAFRQPNRFRLTYRFGDGQPASNEWKQIEDEEQARAIARAARSRKEEKTGRIRQARSVV